MRKRARRSELTWGYSLPPWLEDAGLKSSAAGAVWAGAAWGCVVCANAIWPASRGSNTKPIDAALMTAFLGPGTRVEPTDTRRWGCCPATSVAVPSRAADGGAQRDDSV